VLLLKHTSSGINIDVALGGLPFELTAVGQSVIHELGGIQVRLPRVEDLLLMKAIAHRPKDLLDIEGLLAVHPEADVAAVLQQVREFAAAMSMSDMVDDFEKLLARRKPER
jgi:predicted nucleotidyltransferase